MTKEKMTKDEKAKNERAVFDAPVQKQKFPIYKVVSKGVCVEFTDRLTSASAAYKEAPKPKTMWKIADRYGSSVEKIYEEIM